jgi:hypothetical protein
MAAKTPGGVGDKVRERRCCHVFLALHAACLAHRCRSTHPPLLLRCLGRAQAKNCVK